MKLELTTDQYRWIDGWLHLWGAWVQTGRIDKSMINMIAKFMATVEPQQCSRQVCSDDDGMLISRVVGAHLQQIDSNAYKVLLAYYVYQSSEIRIASWQHATASPRLMKTRGGNQYRKPSISTVRREVKDTLNAALFCLYQPMQNAFIVRDNAKKISKNVDNVLAF
jgi:hypothetical protein